MFNTAAGRRKPENLARDPRASLIVPDGYRFVRVDGTVRANDEQRSRRRTSVSWRCAITRDEEHVQRSVDAAWSKSTGSRIACPHRTSTARASDAGDRGAPPEHRWEPLTLEEVKGLLGIGVGAVVGRGRPRARHVHRARDPKARRHGRLRPASRSAGVPRSARESGTCRSRMTGELIPSEARRDAEARAPRSSGRARRRTGRGAWRCFFEESEGNRWAYRRNEQHRPGHRGSRTPR